VFAVSRAEPAITLHRGFSLTEMAIVLVIVGLLLGGVLVPLSAQFDAANTAANQKAMTEIRDALIGFAIANGRLPCPALAITSSGTGAAGLEPTPVLPGGCANAAGVLPWATLGVGETDVWGRRYSYRVAPEFTRTVPQASFNSGCVPPITPQYAAFALCSQGNITVMANAGGTTLASNVPAILVSHGKNGNGAYTSQGTQLAMGTDADEQDNQLTANGTDTANVSFVSKTPTSSYDDYVTWVPVSILYHRMVAAGKLP
jgi:prepilin-type N-terminal cleavage/methylation domain-containing protein